ncbi:MAG: DegT/DnrJ/EryC1/StrS family aminotransferase [Candidatus Nanopelagicales bacterium]
MNPIALAAPQIGAEEREAVDRVLRSGQLAGGAEVAAFEVEFSATASERICVAVNSGTAALHLGLLAAGVGPGDEVIVPSFTFAATANSVALTGATPVFVDIDPMSFCISPDAVAAVIGPHTAGIMPVHLYGHAASMAALKQLADRHGLMVFEDAAQAHLGRLDDAPVGTFGAFGAFSFYPTKNMTTGEGGMLTCESSAFARTVNLLRNQGMEARYANEIVGFNARMSDIHAAIGRVQLGRLPGWTRSRRANAAFLDSELRGVVTPHVAPGVFHVYHQYTVRIVDHDRDRFASELTRLGIPSAVYYPTPVHELASFRLTLDLPETSLAAEQVLSLPVHPGLDQNDLEQIVRAVNQLANAGA